MSDPTAASLGLAGPERALASLTQLLQQRATLLAERRVFTFLADGEDDALHLTYQDLDRRARAVAARLQALGLEGQRALLLYPPGLEFLAAFFGCLAAGVVAVPAALPRVNRPMPRLRSIATDARPRAVLTTQAQWADADRWSAAVPELAGLPRLATDQVEDDLAADWHDPGARSETLAFLQYTSGSTAAPKGVMITHGNLLHNSALIGHCFGSTEASHGVFWLPLFHDMGLIGGIIQTIYCGGSSTLLSPVAFLQRPARWLQAISRTGATISGGPDFAYGLCVRKVTAAQRDALDLSRWQVAFNGAEPVRADTLDRFAEYFAPAGFRREAFLPCYGMAETTLMVAGKTWSAPPVVRTFVPDALDRNRAEPAAEGRALVGSGGIAAGLDVAIVDPDTRERRPDGEVGEIWVRGPSVAHGYWERPEATAETFQALLGRAGEGPYLRTGDLGFLSDGELFVTGRLKDLIIVGGRNIYPQDIEATIERSHPALIAGGGAALALDAAGAERLVVVQECERPPKGQGADDVLEAIRLAVVEQHELDVHAVHLIRALTLPKTSSGKVRRHACRQALLDGTLETIASWSQQLDDPVRAEPERAFESAARSADAIAQWLAGRIGGPLGLRADEVDVRKPFASFGLGSIQAVSLAADLEQWLSRPLSPTLAYEFPTIESLARHLADAPAPAVVRNARPAAPVDAPIAIVGIGCRFPGASGPDEFWELLRSGIEAVGPVPAGRWGGDHTAVHGGFLDRVDAFDAEFFGIAPREALRMDPQQRLLLEVAWEALEDAGQVPQRLAGMPVGVFVGISTHDYERLPWDAQEPGDAYLLTGNAASIAANRLSYTFDFRGPSLAVDTACSSSLVAIHLACRSLRSGEATLALAGGVNLMLAPEVSAQFARAGFLAPDGRCKTFDASADGYVRGEGAGLVVLKPLAQAEADGDAIYAVIRGGAVNQDGRTNGLTAPSQHAQEAVLLAAYERAGIAPGDVRLVEAHGTGTLLGDPIEAGALARVLADGRPAGRLAAVGSVKTNIGHLEAAAGVAGLIKAALALRHGQVPPSLNYQQPNPHIPFAAAPFFVAEGPIPLPEGPAPVYAGVSSFGFGGTNAHLVLEAPRVFVGVPPLGGNGQPPNGGAPTKSAAPVCGGPGTSPEPVLVPVSARSDAALRQAAQSYGDVFVSDLTWNDVVHTLGTHRSHHDHRLAVVAAGPEEAAERLAGFVRGQAPAGVARGRKPASGRPRVAFVYTGQGALWAGAGRGLLDTEPVFRAVLEECDRIAAREAGWSLLAELTADGPASRVAATEYAQPVLFALQAALTALWRSWGIVPDAVVGHSVGEIAAAHAAGALGLDDALRVAIARGRIMQRVAGQGKTAAVGLGVEELRARLIGFGDAITLAAINGPRSTTVSGPCEAVDALVATLSREGVFARLLAVDCAFHGPQMEPLRAALAAALRDVRPAATAVPLYSTVTGAAIEGTELDAAYWARNLREPVLFAAAAEALGQAGHDVFLEVGPHPALASAIAETLEARERPTTVVPTLRRGHDAREDVLASLGRLYAAGLDVDWAQVNPRGHFVRLPTYPWQRIRFWPGDAPASVVESQRPAAAGGLLYELAWQPETRDLNGHAAWPPEEGLRAHRWLLLGDGDGLAATLAERLAAAGAFCVGNDAAALADATQAPWKVLDLRALGGAAAAEHVAAHCADLAALVAAAARSGAVQVYAVTRGAQAVLDGDVPALGQAALWGLGKCAALEHPAAWGGLIDLDTERSDDQAGRLLAQVTRPDGEDQYALRQRRWYVPRLRAAADATDGSQGIAVRPEGTYVITGGLGDLGLAVARWLVERGARRLVLLGRRGLPPRGTWDALAPDDPARPAVAAVQALEQQGATVLAIAADASDPAGMRAVFERLEAMLPPVRGVVHAAGVVAPRALVELDAGAFLATLRPKLPGAQILDELTRELPLDFFVLFSSVSSVWGSARLADYAAANAALDAFAHARRALGLPAQSINWGPWDAVGMAAAPDWGRSLALMGLRALPASDALRALDRVAGTPARQVTVADVDWHTFKALHAQYGRRHFLDLIEVAAPAPTTGGAAKQEWLALTPKARRARLIAFVRERVARVLGQDPGRVEADRPLTTMGLDSLMAMELRAAIETELGTAVPLTSFLEGPSVAQLVERVLAHWSSDDAESVPLVRSDADADEYALAPNQQSLWFLDRTTKLGVAYQIAGAARVKAPIDTEAFRRALRALAGRHDALRTVFATVDGRPVQRVRDEPEVEFRIEAAEACDESTVEARLAAEARRPFDLERGPLLRVVLYRRAADDHYLLLAIHHIVSDFWSIAVLIDELARLYDQERTGRPADLPVPELRYADFVRWQSALLSGPGAERLWDYWRARLAGPLPDLNLPTDRPRPSVQTQHGASRYLYLDPALSDRLHALGEAEGVSPYTLFLAAFQVLLGRYSGQDDIIVGSPVAGRTRPGLEGVVGYFVNLLPMRSDLSANPPFRDFLRQVRQTVHGALEHQDLPLPVMIQRLQPDRDPSRSPIFQAMFIYQKAQRLDDQGLTPFSLFDNGPRLELSGLSLESVALDKHTALFDVTLTAARAEGRYSLALEYNTDLFDASTIDRLLDHFRTLLGAITAGPEAPVGDLPLVSEDERRVLDTWGTAPARPPAEELVHERIARHARTRSEAEAVVLGTQRVTYGALDARAQRLGRALAARGVGPNVHVALCVERSPELLVALLGVLKAGGAYVPLDPAYPDGRLADVLAEARPRLLLTRRADRTRFKACGVSVVAVEDLEHEEPSSTIPARPNAAHLAYVVYTSGSTGTPKGVMVTHANLASAWRAWEAAYGLGAEPERHLQMAGPAFDVFTGDWVRALASGGTLVICPRETMLDPEALAALLERERIDCAEFVPAIAGPLLEHLEQTGGRLDRMRLVAIGSDLWLAGQHERLRRACGPDTRVVNSYGLTETTIDSTYFEGELAAQPPDRPAPIGRPFAGTRLYVLDRRGNLAAPGVPGELHIGGAGVAAGYLHNPSLTAARFVPDPLAPEPGARMYRTGDVVRWRADGALEFLGRIDAQVKIRGYRIEPGEVEGTLARHPDVRAVVVVARGETLAVRRLIAYVVAKEGRELDAAGLRRWLQERLPEPMVPAAFVPLDALPLSANGKVDRKALPAPPSQAASAGDSPRSAVEDLLARVVGELLARGPVGVHDDLFALGMDSILVIQAVTRVRQAGLRVDPAQLFRHTTIAALAAAIDGAPTEARAATLDHPLDAPTRERLLAAEPAIEDAYPLSPVQQGMLFHDAAAGPGSGVYVEQVVCRLNGPLDLAAFEAAWRRVVARHPMLRTAVRWHEADRPLQSVYREVELPFEVRDWRGIAPSEQPEQFSEFLQDDRARGFVLAWAPLLRVTLVRLADDRAEMVWTVHHIIVDGWCIPLLLQDVLALYENAADDLPEPRLYRDYVAWLGGRDLASAEAYWRRALRGYADAVTLALDGPTNGHGPRPVLTECEATLSAEVTENLRRLARVQGLTLNTIVQGAWALLLSRYSGRADVAFGVAVSGRPAELDGVEAMIGMFVNTLPLRVDVDEDAMVGPWLRSVQARQVAMRQFEYSPLVDVQGWSEIPRGRPLFESVVVFQNTPLDAAALARAGALGVADVRVLGQTNYPLTLTAIPGPALRFALGYDERRFDAAAVERLLGHLTRLLEEIATGPERRLADLTMLTDAEQSLVHAGQPTVVVEGLLVPHVDGLSDEELDLYLERLQSEPGAER